MIKLFWLKEVSTPLISKHFSLLSIYHRDIKNQDKNAPRKSAFNSPSSALAIKGHRLL